MSVYANTLNAYAARLKAQRRAAEREAIKKARAKSDQQREAERALRVSIRAQQTRPDPTLKQAIDFWVSGVSRKFKSDYQMELATGERAKITSLIAKMMDVYCYDGEITASFYKTFDLSVLSTTAYEMVVSVLANMDLIKAHNGHQAIRNNFRRITIYKTRDGVSLALDQSTRPVSEITDSIRRDMAQQRPCVA